LGGLSGGLSGGLTVLVTQLFVGAATLNATRSANPSGTGPRTLAGTPATIDPGGIT
jgi:hypothetical protein